MNAEIPIRYGGTKYQKKGKEQFLNVGIMKGAKMELNREQIKKALECCFVNDWNSTKCNECPFYNGGGGCIDELKEFTIAFINSQEQKIFELENRLKECENGYEGTLFLDRCKLHDAEEKVKELTEENEKLHASCTELTQKCASLTEENERLRAENIELIMREGKRQNEIKPAKDLTARAEGEWISVKEELPDNYRAVLVVCKSTSISGGTLRAIGSYGGGFWSMADADGTMRLTKYMQYIVTHWMELPTVPKGE